MNREIKEVAKLLAEIDKICKREGIPYYLGPQLTLCCVTGQEITSPHAGVVYMRTADMERFRLAVEKETPDGRIVEMIEIKDHPFFIATQAHPELKSRPNRPHPLFRGFVKASIEKN